MRDINGSCAGGREVGWAKEVDSEERSRRAVAARLKSEARSPKVEGRKKSEVRSAEQRV